jgi:hypothetical protein
MWVSAQAKNLKETLKRIGRNLVPFTCTVGNRPHPCDNGRMLAEWSAECAADDPVLVVPWQDPNSPAAFVDLRLNPYDFDQLPEAEQYPSLMQALRALNAPRSPVFTAKCDAWIMSPEEVETLQLNLDMALDTADLGTGFATYIDLVWRDRTIFASFHQQGQQMHKLVRLASPLDHPYAGIEGIIRPAFVDLTGPQEGFAVSLYTRALGADVHTATENWGAALESIVSLLRSRDFSPS